MLATLLAITYDAQRDGTWARLKICHHDACRWAFFDESRGRTATWCAMGICGNRTKVTAYRRRQAAKRQRCRAERPRQRLCQTASSRRIASRCQFRYSTGIDREVLAGRD